VSRVPPCVLFGPERSIRHQPNHPLTPSSTRSYRQASVRHSTSSTTSASVDDDPAAGGRREPRTVAPVNTGQTATASSSCDGFIHGGLGRAKEPPE
jgi:hypothetical protein